MARAAKAKRNANGQGGVYRRAEAAGKASSSSTHRKGGESGSAYTATPSGKLSTS